MAAGYLIHADIDAFFASLEQVRRPELRGSPVVVGGGIGGRGVVASASYEARRHGLKAGMPIQRAREFCADAVYLAPDHDEYNRVAGEAFEVLSSLSPSVQQMSLDEVCVDLAGCERMYGTWGARPVARLPFECVQPGVYRRSEARAVPVEARRMLPRECRWAVAVALWAKRAVREKTGLTLSVGVGANRLVAKLASGACKPNGTAVVQAGSEAEFVAGCDLGELPGLGRATRSRLLRWNVRTVEQARRIPREALRDVFGDARGDALFRILRGEDPGAQYQDGGMGANYPKSISRETTFWTPSNDAEFVTSMLFYLTERLGRALRRQGLRGRTVRLKMRYEDQATVQCSRSLGVHTDEDTAIFEAVRALFGTRWRRNRRLRLVGVGLTDLRPAGAWQRSLFDDGPERCRRLDRCLDALRDRFGFRTVQRGPSIDLYRYEAEQSRPVMPESSPTPTR